MGPAEVGLKVRQEMRLRLESITGFIRDEMLFDPKRYVTREGKLAFVPLEAFLRLNADLAGCIKQIGSINSGSELDTLREEAPRLEKILLKGLKDYPPPQEDFADREPWPNRTGRLLILYVAARLQNACNRIGFPLLLDRVHSPNTNVQQDFFEEFEEYILASDQSGNRATQLVCYLITEGCEAALEGRLGNAGRMTLNQDTLPEYAVLRSQHRNLSRQRSHTPTAEFMYRMGTARFKSSRFEGLVTPPPPIPDRNIDDEVNRAVEEERRNFEKERDNLEQEKFEMKQEITTIQNSKSRGNKLIMVMIAVVLTLFIAAIYVGAKAIGEI